MVRKTFFLMAAFALLPGVGTLSQSGEKASSVPITEIDKLIRNLGHVDFQVREKAMKRLEEIGEPALEPLYEAQKRKNAEISQRAKLLASEIEWRVLPSKTVNGAQFKFVVDKIWRIPRPGEKNNIRIRLDVRNISEKAYRICPAGVQVRLTDSKGKDVPSGGGNLASVSIWYSPPLKKNQIFSIELKANLAQQHSNKLQFSVMDSFTSFHDFEILSKGTFHIMLGYRNFSEHPPGFTDPCWVGKVVTFPQKVEIE